MAQNLEGQQTAATALGAAAPALTAVPYVGPILSLAATATAAGLSANVAAQQKKRAEALRQEGINTPKEMLRPEYIQALRSARFSEQAGLPGKELWKNYLDNRLATQARNIRESSPSGQATLEALSAAYGQNADSLNQMAINDSQFRSGASKDVRNMLWDTGGEQRKLELEQTRIKENLFSGANALENASTANKQGAINQIAGAVGSTATAITGNIQEANKNKMWSDYLKGLTATGKTDPAMGISGSDSNGNPVSMNPFSGYTPSNTNFSTPLWQQMNSF